MKQEIKKNGGSVEVKTDTNRVSVQGKSQPGVVEGVNVTGKAIDIKGENRSTIVMGNVRGSVINVGSGKIFINGQLINPSQSTPRRETQVVLQVPIPENADKQEKPKPMYTLEVGSGNITVEKGRGKYTISAGAGDVEIKGCDVAAYWIWRHYSDWNIYKSKYN